jgi:hypothetical protein
MTAPPPTPTLAALQLCWLIECLFRVIQKFGLELCVALMISNFLEAQEKLADTIVSASSQLVGGYFWRLSGDEPNSLCRFLGMEEDELKVILRLCKIYIGEKDNLSKKNLDSFVTRAKCEHTTYRIKKQLVWFIMIGNNAKLLHARSLSLLPQHMHPLVSPVSEMSLEIPFRCHFQKLQR